MSPVDDLLSHFLATLGGTIPLIGFVLAMYLPARDEQRRLARRVDRNEALDRVRGRIISQLMTELRMLAPDWEPGPNLAADFAEMERLEAARDNCQ